MWCWCLVRVVCPCLYPLSLVYFGKDLTICNIFTSNFTDLTSQIAGDFAKLHDSHQAEPR